MKSLENLKFPDNFMENPLSLNIIVAKFGDGTYVNVDQDVFFYVRLVHLLFEVLF